MLLNQDHTGAAGEMDDLVLGQLLRTRGQLVRLDSIEKTAASKGGKFAWRAWLLLGEGVPRDILVPSPVAEKLALTLYEETAPRVPSAGCSTIGVAPWECAEKC